MSVISYSLIFILEIALLTSFLFSFGEYQNDRPLIDKISGVNINIAAWDWYPNDRNNWDGFTPSEFWVYLSYYHQRKYAVNLIYEAHEQAADDHDITVTYNTLLATKFINRSGILIENFISKEPTMKLYTSLSYDSNVIINLKKSWNIINVETFITDKIKEKLKEAIEVGVNLEPGTPTWKMALFSCKLNTTMMKSQI